MKTLTGRNPITGEIEHFQEITKEEYELHKEDFLNYMIAFEQDASIGAYYKKINMKEN